MIKNVKRVIKVKSIILQVSVFMLLFSFLLISAGCDNSKSVESDAAYQLQAPVKGDTIAIMKTTMGDIKIKFFPKEAPKAVENFTKLSEQGYYNGLTFHRVIKDFMIQSGDPQGNGTGGESIWKKPFNDEFSKKLHNYRGALSMANRGSNTNTSQFFINQNPKITSSTEIDMEKAKASEALIFQYKKLGGAPHLDNKHTVFGQVYEGLDVVDKIAGVRVDPNSNKPYEDIKIIGIEITKVP